MQIRFSPNQTDYQKLGTAELRAAFLVDSLFAPGKLELVYSDADRAIIGSAVPTNAPLKLSADAELRAAFFCERRELGVLNIGGAANSSASMSGAATRTFPSPARTQRIPRRSTC